ncbi:hypothetical protein AND4_10584 [Vibrio sp. AND4]|nr:hypothetical protein AND4_10584 [Vibrio sp. AND4]
MPIKKSAPVDTPTHLLLFIFITRVLGLVINTFRKGIIQLGQGGEGSNIYTHAVRGH